VEHAQEITGDGLTVRLARVGFVGINGSSTH
jgi:hypothetical protein